MPWIRTIEPEDADGRLAEAYAWQAQKPGFRTKLPGIFVERGPAHSPKQDRA